MINLSCRYGEIITLFACSAGIGRTGVFMLMETALCKMEVLEPIYPLEIVRAMRDQRGMLVQTPVSWDPGGSYLRHLAREKGFVQTWKY